jgi:hypothetical protein
MHGRLVSDQRAQVDEMFLRRLALARIGALPFADEILQGEWHGRRFPLPDFTIPILPQAGENNTPREMDAVGEFVS